MQIRKRDDPVYIFLVPRGVCLLSSNYWISCPYLFFL